MRLFVLSTLAILLFMITGCEQDIEQDNSSYNNRFFRMKEDVTGYVVEVNEKDFLVEYEDDKFFQLSVADQSILEELKIGDFIIIEIDGGVLESNPLQAAAGKVLIVDDGDYSY